MAQPIIPPDLRKKPRRPLNSDVGRRKLVPHLRDENMKKNWFALLVSISLLWMANATAQAAEEETPCRDIQISAQVDDCIRQQYATADRQLNNAYRLLMAKIDGEYKDDPRLGAEFKASIKKAQQAWLGFRDANCDVGALEIERGTSAHDTTTRACKLRMTKARTQEIESTLK